ncbi:MAG: alpha/beta hydrolase [Actinomycetota bacterium]|nr:alpha/beta hydrolase [Actinomycetota bacterium]
MSASRLTDTCRRRRVTAAAAITALIAVCAACSSSDSTPTTTTNARSCRGTGFTATKNVAYETMAGVDPNLLSLDYYRPIRAVGCGPAPMVVFVHGGGFAIGDKANKISDKVKLFTDEGWVFASVNYRLSPSPPNDLAGQIRYPTHEQDVVTALAWLKSHSAPLGGDPDRILLVGHSSGAFLVSLVSTDSSFLAAAGLSTHSIPCTAALDTEFEIPKQIDQGGSQEALYRNAFGNDPATWVKGSPINHTEAGTLRPEFLIFTQGAPRRTAQARAFADALNRGGTAATLVDVSPLAHDEVNEAVGQPGDTRVTPPLMAFLRSCAGTTAPSSERTAAGGQPRT